MKEIIKPISGYMGRYLVSNMGYVISTIGKKPRVLKHGLTGPKGKKYKNVILRKDGVSKNARIHSLVAEAFLGPRPNHLVTDHINNDKMDNRAENLQYITNRENSSKDRKGSSKYTGVHWRKHSKKWVSSIRVKGKLITIGFFLDEYKAHKAYQSYLKTITEGISK